MRTAEARPSAGRRGLGDVLGFLAFSHGWTWVFWAAAGVLAAAAGVTVWDMPPVALFVLGGVGVPLGGLVMSWVTGQRAGLHDLARRIIDPRRLTPRWWTVTLLLFPAITLTAAGISIALGVTATPLDLDGTAARIADPLGLLVMIGFVLIIGPLPEEVGWRGYLLDRLQLRLNALAASLIIAVAWWAWHLPLFVLPGYFQAFGGPPASALAILPALVPTAILLTWIYNNTNRSVLAVILAHLVDNLTGELLGVADEIWPLRVLVAAAVAILVSWWWGPHSLRRNEAERGLPELARRREPCHGPRGRVDATVMASAERRSYEGTCELQREIIARGLLGGR
jgi:uncharacterized protein